MNWDIVEGKWKQFAGNLKDTWGKFTDSDITQLSGKRDHLVGLVQERYGVAKEEAEKQVDTWASKVKDESAGATKDAESAMSSAKDKAHDVTSEAKEAGHGVVDALADVANKAAEALVHASKATAAYVAEKTSK